MPSEVARAYRDPLELGVLFATEVFTDQDRFAVRDELLRRLVGKYGNAEIESGSKLATITQRVAKFKKNPWKSIDLLMSVPEYGGKESVKRELAHVMQPYWSKWWDSFMWRDWESISKWNRIADIVLGSGQLRWAAAQYARAVIDLVRQKDRQAALAAIEAAERFAADESSDNARRMAEEVGKAYYLADQSFNSPSEGAAIGAAIMSGSMSAFVPGYAVFAANTALSTAWNRLAYYEPYARLMSLTRQLIIPTLITTASRGLR